MEIHDKTEHSYISVRSGGRYIDWNSQPEGNKFYPKFFQRFDVSKLANLELIGKTTFSKTYGDSSYHLRTVPSAGALYPCEIYIQLRRQKGYLDGVYHYDQKSNNLALLHTLERDGLEAYIDENKYGIVFLISSVYFRSSWKYRDRAIRYVLLDAGHQIGAIAASLNLEEKNFSVNFDLDFQGLNENFGFEGSEFFLGAVTCEELEKRSVIDSLDENLPFVSPTDYIERNKFIEDSYKLFLEESKNSYQFQLPKVDKTTILKRRSERYFGMREFDKEFFNDFYSLIDLANSFGVNIYFHSQNLDELSQGLYKNRELIKQGNFKQKCRYLGLEQDMIIDANLSLFFTADDNLYFQKYILAGVIGHYIYLIAIKYNLGCSGVGAYYDRETQEFLETNENILYMMIVG